MKESSEKYGKDVTVELGLQSSNAHTLLKLGRCHTALSMSMQRSASGATASISARMSLRSSLGRPVDVIETAKLISVLPVTEVKIHSLYIVKGTELARMYERGEVTLSTMEEYMERVALFLAYLRKDIVIQRIVGRASGGNTLTVNGGSPWWEVKSRIDELLEERNITQGCLCDYIDGKAVRHFL